MKIALCKSHLAGPVSGADETLVAYAIASHQAKHNIEVVLIHRCAEHDQYYVRLKNAGVPVSFVVARSPFYSVLLRIRNLLASVLFFIFLIPGSMDFLRRLWQAIITFTTQFQLKLFSPKAVVPMMVETYQRVINGETNSAQQVGSNGHHPCTDGHGSSPTVKEGLWRQECGRAQ